MAGRARRTKLVAIEGFDEELYRLIKTYAALEGRTVSSIFEEALKRWVESRRDYDEVRVWAGLEREYEENLKAVREEVGSHPTRYEGGYALACEGRLIGVFKEYAEAVEEARRKCRRQALIVKLPYREAEKIELGLPW